MRRLNEVQDELVDRFMVTTALHKKYNYFIEDLDDITDLAKRTVVEGLMKLFKLEHAV